jgi:glycosyltransferase involved in cell wall biosynthesis
VRVVALYPSGADALSELYGISSDVIRVIPRGVPTRGFGVADGLQRDRARTDLGLDPAISWVAYVGALSREKDPLLAIESLAHLPEDVGLVVAGGGPMSAEVRTRARAFGPRVQLLGVTDAVNSVYSASEALVLPSHTEGVPGSAIEAGLSGLPVVSFDVGGVSSVVLHEKTGLLVDGRTPLVLASAVTRAIANRSEWGTAAREHCLASFSMESVGGAWKTLIDEVTEE